MKEVCSRTNITQEFSRVILGSSHNQPGLGDALDGLSSLMREGADMMEHVPDAFQKVKNTFDK